MDCGNDLGVDLPGINYAIADTAYLRANQTQDKGLPNYSRPLRPHRRLAAHCAKISGANLRLSFTIGRVEEIFENFGLPMPEGFELKTVVMNEEYS